MSFFNLLQHTITTQRLVQGVGIQKTYQTNLTGQPCLIQPISAEFASKTGFAFGKTYRCMLPIGTDIVMSDHVTDQNGYNYTVEGSLDFNYGQNTQHLTVILTRQAGQGYQQ